MTCVREVYCRPEVDKRVKSRGAGVGGVHLYNQAAARLLTVLEHTHIVIQIHDVEGSLAPVPNTYSQATAKFSHSTVGQ